MDPNAYNQFTETLVGNLNRDERVLGLVAVGSMAATHHQPDEWSDHDFLRRALNEALLLETPQAALAFARACRARIAPDK